MHAGVRGGDAGIDGDLHQRFLDILERERTLLDAGAQMLGRRGEDQRLREDRPAAGRRRAIDELMPERGETEVRADVARRLDQAAPTEGEEEDDA